MTTYSAELIIDSSKIISNISHLKSLISDESKFMFIVKSNAYGHCLVEIVKNLESYVDAFGVVRMEEAISIRQVSSKPILLMQGIYTDHEIELAKENNIQIVIHNMNQLKLIGSNESDLGLWIKINTGMNRLGLSQDELKLINKKGIIGSNSVLMTHMACADNPDDPMNKMQIKNFEKAFNSVERKTKRSVCNSACLINFPELSFDWVRSGIAAYGGEFENLNLKTAMTFRAPIVSIRNIKKGERVGYGGRKKASKDMRIAIVYAGYADGIPQTTIDGTKVLVNDRHAEIFGRVSMDLVSIDVTNLPNVSENDLVSFWSEELPINEFSNKNRLISYELMTKISGRVEVKIT
ncbi:MAG: alanine racemase [Gammaproteobacteria bacterium]